MTKKFSFCPDDYRTAHELQRGFTELVEKIAFSVDSAHVQRVVIAPKDPVSMCCGENELIFSVDYNIEKPEKIECRGSCHASNQIGNIVVDGMRKWGLKELERLQSWRDEKAKA